MTLSNVAPPRRRRSKITGSREQQRVYVAPPKRRRSARGPRSGRPPYGGPGGSGPRVGPTSRPVSRGAAFDSQRPGLSPRGPARVPLLAVRLVLAAGRPPPGGIRTPVGGARGAVEGRSKQQPLYIMSPPLSVPAGTAPLQRPGSLARPWATQSQGKQVTYPKTTAGRENG